jgi:tetratricopeptide (TPR) repeat protein
MTVRSGELALRPLPAVLLDLHEHGVTGRLILKRGRVIKAVDLVDGDPVSTTSTPRDETLGHFLVSSGAIAEEQHRQAVMRAAATGERLGECLVAMGVLTGEQLAEQLTRQARHKLVQALRWPQGAWRLEEAALAGEGRPLRMIEVVLGGLRETAVEDLERLARLEGMRFELTERGHRLAAELARAYGESAVRELTGGARIDSIERAVGDRATARAAVDALLLCDAIQATVAPTGLGTGASVAVAVRAGDARALPPGTAITAEPPSARPAPGTLRAPTRPLAPGSALFDILFDDLGPPDLNEGGSRPLEFPDAEADDGDSGVVSTVDLSAAAAERELAAAAQKALAAEHLRVHGSDHYAALMVDRRARPQEIDTAFALRCGLVEQWTRRVVEARDRQRADEVRGVYAAARRVLLDDRQRAAYDRELAGGELMQGPPSMDTEATFRMAEELMDKGQWLPAIGLLRKVIARSPTEADYHAALGWAEWMAHGESAAAADSARVHLNGALEIDPDHAAAHDYKGRIDAALRDDDDAALFHLERAVDLDPSRLEALARIEAILCARGELRRYERILKRLLFRIRGRGTLTEARAWAHLARLYLDHIYDPAAAAAAAANAQRAQPRNAEIAALVERAEAQASSTQPARAGWREALSDPRSGAALVHSTRAHGHIDAAFLAASTMMALGTADPQMAALYEAHRVRGAALPAHTLGREHWALLRHKHDTVEIGALVELVAPAIHAAAPMTLADGDLDASQRVAEADLPPAFGGLLAHCAALLGVPPPPVYARVELGAQIHVVAADPPVLIAGDDALSAPAGPGLVFALARAMTFLWPGRAVGASRPGRVLRAVVMAVFREASGTTVGLDDPLAARATEAVLGLPLEVRIDARAAALRLLSRGAGINLSLWARALARTADRAGMLLCGDVPAAVAGAREVGEVDRDLLEFAFSAAHVQLRAQLGLARG